MIKNRKLSLLLLFLSWAGHLPVASGATIIVYHLTLNTSSLKANPTVNAAAPFYLDFQFNDGQGTGDGNNTVTASNFTYGAGGSASGTPILSGGASGSLSAGVTLTDSGFYNDFTHGFTPGDLLSFDITLSMPTADVGGAPDLFTFAILHSGDVGNQGLLPIPTTDPGYQLLTIALDPSSPLVSTFAVVPHASNPETPPGIAAFQANVVVVPEPNVAFFGLALLAFTGGVRRLGRGNGGR